MQLLLVLKYLGHRGWKNGLNGDGRWSCRRLLGGWLSKGIPRLLSRPGKGSSSSCECWCRRKVVQDTRE